MLWNDSMIQWLGYGEKVLENSFRIPRQKKWISHERRSREWGIQIFFAEGWGGNFPIPSSHIQAINIVLDWKINKVVKKRVLTNTLFLKNRVLINTLFLKKGYWPIPCFHRRYWEMYWDMDISVLFFNIIQCIVLYCILPHPEPLFQSYFKGFKR